MSFQRTSMGAVRRLRSPYATLPIPSQCHLRRSTQAHFIGTNTKTEKTKARSRLDPITLHRLEHARRNYYKRRLAYSGVGVLFGLAAIYITARQIPLEPPLTTENSADSSASKDDPLVALGRERKVIVQKLGEEPEERSDTVSTGASAVPEFPRVLEFADSEEGIDGKGPEATEYQLLGLGVRTVSFLRVQVYVVGIYVATDDIASLQDTLIKKVNKGASTLVAGEKDVLREMLKDPEQSEEVWNSVLSEAGLRTLVRIVPTRNTDFGHLRDAWVRALTSKSQADRTQFGDEAFGQSVKDFRTMFSRGNIPKGKELLLSRNKGGKLAVWYDDGNSPQRLGSLADERISRIVWMGYLAGKTVASEKARESVIEGIMEFVERPVGTVATQVHV